MRIKNKISDQTDLTYKNIFNLNTNEIFVEL